MGTRPSYNNTHIHHIYLRQLRCKNKSWFHKGMCENIVPDPVPIVIVSDVVSGVTVTGLVGPAVDVSASVVVLAKNYKFSYRFNKVIKTSMIMVVIFSCTQLSLFYLKSKTPATLAYIINISTSPPLLGVPFQNICATNNHGYVTFVVITI